MKYILLLLVMIILGAPTVVRADQVLGEQEVWQYQYEFTFTWNGSVLVPAASYQMTSGESTTFVPGPWRLEILDGKRLRIAVYEFDPAVMATGTTLTLKVPYEGRGFYAVVYDSTGVQSAEIRVSASRVCDDDGACEKDAGESWWLCPTDCGGYASQGREVQAAAIAPQIPVSAKIGGMLVRLSFAAAGLMLLLGGWQMLDSRRRS